MGGVDVHIITMPSESQEWLSDCLNSLWNEPVNLYFIDGVEGHIGEGRYAGFTQGTSDYISFVDPDDLVNTGAFKKCIDVLDANSNLTGVGTAEAVLWGDDIVYPQSTYSQSNPEYTYRSIMWLHHLVVMRRAHVEKHLHLFKNWSNWCETAFYLTLFDEGALFDFIETPEYFWRKRADGSHRAMPHGESTNYINDLVTKFCQSQPHAHAAS